MKTERVNKINPQVQHAHRNRNGELKSQRHPEVQGEAINGESVGTRAREFPRCLRHHFAAKAGIHKHPPGVLPSKKAEQGVPQVQHDFQ